VTAPGQAQQGHRYLWCGVDEVLALESGQRVRVAVLDSGQPWLGAQYAVDAADLTPLPMRYFHGQTPA
jgi:hypothetical protein